jgi:hypothetical protein
VTNYVYDAEGQRVAKMQNGVEQREYYYDMAGHLLTEADGSGN